MLIVLGGIGWIIATAVFAFRSRRLEQTEVPTSGSYWLTTVTRATLYEFPVQDNVEFIFGVSGLDRSGISRWDTTNLGTVQLNADFDLSAPANQKALLAFCDSLNQTQLILPSTLQCWISDFSRWLPLKNQTFPVAQPLFMLMLAQFLNTPYATRYLAQNAFGLLNQTLRYTKVYAQYRGTDQDPADQRESDYALFENFVAQSNGQLPTGLSTMFQTAGTMWPVMEQQRQYQLGL